MRFIWSAFRFEVEMESEPAEPKDDVIYQIVKALGLGVWCFIWSRSAGVPINDVLNAFAITHGVRFTRTGFRIACDILTSGTMVIPPEGGWTEESREEFAWLVRCCPYPRWTSVIRTVHLGIE